MRCLPPWLEVRADVKVVEVGEGLKRRVEEMSTLRIATGVSGRCRWQREMWVSEKTSAVATDV